jgi:hypothetical protein
MSEGNRLDALVREIKEAQAKEEAESKTIIIADGNRRQVRIVIGRLLIEAKKAVEHGQWLPWLDAHFGWSERTARHYMYLAGADDPEATAEADRAADAERKRSERAAKSAGQPPRPSDLTPKGDALAAINNARPNPQPERWAAATVGKLSAAIEMPKCDGRGHAWSEFLDPLVMIADPAGAIRILWARLDADEQAELLDELTAPAVAANGRCPMAIDTL